MHGREGHHKTRLRGEPLGDGLTMRRPDIVTDKMTRPDVLGNLLIHVFQEGEAFLLSFACIPVSIDPSGTGIEGRKEVEGASACLRGLIAVGQVLRLRWLGRGQPRTRLQGGVLVTREDHLVIVEWTCVVIEQFGDRGIKCGISWLLGRPPQLLAPRFQLRRGQDPADGRCRNVLHEPICDELARQVGTVPWREATAEPSGAFAGQAYHVDGDRRGGNRPWRRGRGRP